MITHIGTVGVYVADQQRSVEFWTEKLGFQLRRREPMGPDAYWLEVGPANAQTCLVLYPRSMMHNWAEMKPSLVLECADIGATVEQMRLNGVEFIQEPRAMPWGTYAIFKDIDGNEFILKGD